MRRRLNVKSTNNKHINKLRILLVLSVLGVAVALVAVKAADVYSPGGQSAPNDTVSVPAFDKSLNATDEPASLWAVVNKGRKLPGDYIPADLVVPDVALRFAASSPEMMLRNDAAQALKELFTAAEAQNLPLILTSGYRSYGSQAAIYSRNVARDGQAATDAVSARPGHSEHQTGLGADIGSKSRKCEFDKCFGTLPEGAWVAANAHSYGFIIRYEQGKTSLTGYDFEPWHLRYVGKELANELYKAGQTMEQFFGLPAFAEYPAEPLRL